MLKGKTNIFCNQLLAYGAAPVASHTCTFPSLCSYSFQLTQAAKCLFFLSCFLATTHTQKHKHAQTKMFPFAFKHQKQMETFYSLFAACKNLYFLS